MAGSSTDSGPRVPDIRIRVAGATTALRRPRATYVLYWMIAARRTRYNPGLQRAVALARQNDCGLLVLEPLRLGYRWASERLHAFVIDGMRDNRRALADTGVRYYPYIEPRCGDGRGLLAALARRAHVIVTDDYPAFFAPRMIAAAARDLEVRVECVDGNGLWPMWATERVFTTAASFRIHLQKELAPHLAFVPLRNPLARRRLRPLAPLPRSVTRRWPEADLGMRTSAILDALDLDRSAAPVALRGGVRAARKALTRFLEERLPRYRDGRNHPPGDRRLGGASVAQSELSPYLHFGHLSAHEILIELGRQQGWSPERIAPTPTRSRTGWWGMDENAEAFMDQLSTWRELGFNMCSHRPAEYDRYGSLPAWARTTLAEHAGDPRPFVYDDRQLEEARTHDPLWNAAQTQLVREGRMHNYMRMLWGKKILEWSPDAERALEIMIHLNNKYALDGRDPNSYSGIFWVLGRYDRAWGPERPIFGKVRYMSSDSAARKLDVKGYLQRYRPDAG